MVLKPNKDNTKPESYRLDNVESISHHQFDFRRKHSPIEQTHKLVRVLRKTFEEEKY